MMTMEDNCYDVKKRIEVLSDLDPIDQHVYLLKESPSKEYYLRAKEIKNKYEAFFEETMSIAQELECQNEIKELEELREELQKRLNELDRAIKEHEKSIKTYEDSYAVGLAKIVNAVLTGKVEKKEPKSLLDKIIIAFSPKPRDIEKTARKIADDIMKKNHKKLLDIVKEIDYDGMREELEEKKKELESLEYDNLKIDYDFITRNYKDIILKSFIPDLKEVEKIRNSLVQLRIKIETLGGDPSAIEKTLPIHSIDEYIKGAISFEELSSGFYKDFVERIVERVNELNEKNYKKFKDDVEKQIKDIENVIGDIF